MLFCILNSSKHCSLRSATRNVDESLHQKLTLLSVWGFEFGIPIRYTDFKIALDTALLVYVCFGISLNSLFFFFFQIWNPHVNVREKKKQYCYTLSPTADIFCVWFTVTLVYRNIKVATITIACVQLQPVI